jgi:DNA repair exonuclease SbcCD ATPase subunit
MNSPIEKFPVDASKWRCCEKMLRSEYCPACGKQRPEEKWSSRIQDIIDGWENERCICEKTAATFRDKMTAIEIGLEEISAAKTWQELEVIQHRLSFYSLYYQQKGEKVSLEKAKNQSASEGKSRFSNMSAQRDAHLRKADAREYWVKTVCEILRMIPDVPVMANARLEPPPTNSKLI